MTASELDDVDESDGSRTSNKIIKSAFDSESFDSDGIIHAEGLKGSATISPCGRDVALASPEGLAIIDLDSPYNAPRMIKSHGMPWLVVDAQWSPFAARDYWVASTANHRCLVWNLNRADDSSAGSVEHSLSGHRRSITDINFSAHHPDMLATCSVDGYVHCWDLRRATSPALTFIDWTAGATQVKYNRQDEHVLASSHNRSVHIWDDRFASQPMRTIEAHASKIYGLDWNRTRSTCLVTCSLDKTIKFWDYADRNKSASLLDDHSSSDDVPERVIRTHFPVWRARHTPFSGGLLAMPQNAPGHLYLYDARSTVERQRQQEETGGVEEDANEPVAVFAGHGHHKVKEFLWRTRGGIDNGCDNREFQMVSWGNDSKLRLRRFDGPDLATVGFQRGQKVPANLNMTRKGAAYKTFRVLEDLGDYEKRSATMSSVRPYSRRGVGENDGRSGVQSPEHPQQHTIHTHAHVHAHWASSSAQVPSSPPARPLPRTSSMRDVVQLSGMTPRQRTAWRNRSMRATKATGRPDAAERSNVQLDWMKGVTMSRRRWGGAGDEVLGGEEGGQRRKVSSERMEDSAQWTVGTVTSVGMSSPLQLSAHGTSVSGGGDYYAEAEPVQEEIVRITDRLGRSVTWEDVNMDSLTLVAAMKGPWGADNQAVYVKVRVTVPAAYPATRAPRFYLENSSLVPAATQDRLASELHVIAAEFLKRRRNCLLAAFRYLLGVTDLTATLALLDRPVAASWLANDAVASHGGGEDTTGGSGVTTTAITGTAGETGEGIDDSSSSSDDDMGDGAFVADQGPAPPPRSCGAFFTRDGRLVCFFLTKAGKASAKLLFEPPEPPTSEELAELEKPVFIGFGQVLTARRRRRRRGSEAGGSDSSDASDSDSAVSSSSSSSASSAASSSASSRPSMFPQSVRNLVDPWSMNMGFQRRIVRGRAAEPRRRRLRGGTSDGDGTVGRSGRSDSLARSGTMDADPLDPLDMLDLPLGPKSTVVVEDLSSLLPAKRALAREYAVFGDGAEVCAHNAGVAEKYGEVDLAHVWRYAALLLKSDVPLRLVSTYVDAGRRQKSVLVIAREAVALAEKQQRSELRGRVKWGLHPLARDFVDDLFAHFEQRADMQMLAMLSCVFGEAFEEDSVAYAESHISQPDTPLPMKAPSFSLDYVPTTRGLLHGTPPVIVGGLSSAAVFYDGSIDPDEDVAEDEEDEDGFGGDEDDSTVWETGPDTVSRSNSFSGGETPPKWGNGRDVEGRDNRDNREGRDGRDGPSSSPLLAAGRFFRRGNNAVVSALAASIPQTLTTLLSSSPQGGGGAVGVTSPPPATPVRNPLPNNAVQPLSQAYRQLLLHSTSASRDIPAGHGSRRLTVSSTSVSPRSSGTHLGKLSSSPSSSQDQGGRKRPSPAETIFGNLTSGNLTWAASALFGGGGGAAGTEGGTTVASSMAEEGRRRGDAIAAAAASAAAKGAKAQAEAAGTGMVAVDMHVRTYNDHLFDDDGWMVASLLSGQTRRRRQYAEYRYAYSELLQVWGEPLTRLEVLKFNVLREDAMRAVRGSGGATKETAASQPGGQDASTASRSDLGSRRSRLTAVRDSGRGLDAVGVCVQCEMQLEPAEYGGDSPGGSLWAGASAPGTLGGAVGYCRRCRLLRAQLRCVYCAEPVDALYLPCFGCGCASHPACLRAWHAAGERVCPAGDECVCAEEATNGRIESWTAMQAELGTLAATSAASIPSIPSTASLPASSTRAKGLIAQARRSTHYASASTSSSASLLLPYGVQHYRDDDARDRGGFWSGSGRRARQTPQPQPQRYAYEGPGREALDGQAAGDPQSARFSLSSRLLRGSTLRRQASGNQMER